MGIPPIYKNNGDQVVTREIQELRHDLEQNQKDDQVDHQVILDKLAALSLEQRTSSVLQNERASAEGTIRRQVFALLLLFLTTVAGIIAWVESEFSDIHDDISNNSRIFSAFEARGIKWGEQLDKTDADMQEQLRELRRRINKKHD